MNVHDQLDVLPLPFGDRRKSPFREERAGVRGHAGQIPTSRASFFDFYASTYPSPQSSPRTGEEANATSEEFH